MGNLKFSKKSKEAKELKNRYKVMIVDDEVDVHKVTTSLLKDFRFEGSGVEFISAYSAKEAKEAIKNNPDTALILLDVVMEEDDSGLKVAKYIREELQNRFVRIVLRTGQPGQAPEEDVVIKYDINDYKEKTELTSTKFFTLIYSSLRSYRDIIELEKSRKFISTILDTTGAIITVIDKDGKIKDTNKTIKKVTHFSSDEINGKYIWELFPIEYEANHIKDMFNTLNKDSFPTRFESHLKTKDDKPVFVTWSNTAFSEGNEDIAFVVGTGINIDKQSDENSSYKELNNFYHFSYLEFFLENIDNLNIVKYLYLIELENLANKDRETILKFATYLNENFKKCDGNLLFKFKESSFIIVSEKELEEIKEISKDAKVDLKVTLFKIDSFEKIVELKKFLNIKM